MAEFMSEAWIAAFSTAVAGMPRMVGVDEPFVVEQRVTGGLRGDACYYIVFASDRIDVRIGAASNADITFITDFATAVALHQGEMNAQRAIASGGMRVRGAFDVLMRNAEWFSMLGDAFAELRASTSWPSSLAADPSASTGAETTR